MLATAGSWMTLLAALVCAPPEAPLDVGPLVNPHRIGVAEPVRTVVFSPVGSRLAAGGRKSIYVIDAGARTVLATLVGHEMPVYGLAFSADSSQLASLSHKARSQDSDLRIWDARAGTQLATLKASHVQSVAFFPDGRLLTAERGPRGKVRIWDPRGATELRTFLLGPGSSNVDDFALSAGGRLLVFSARKSATREGQRSGVLHIRETRSGKPRHELVCSDDFVRFARLSPAGGLVACGSDAEPDPEITLFDAGTGKELRRLKGRAHELQDGVFTPDGATFVSLEDYRTLGMFRVATGDTLGTVPIESCSATNTRSSERLPLRPSVASGVNADGDRDAAAR